jgi:hypothetical protein
VFRVQRKTCHIQQPGGGRTILAVLWMLLMAISYEFWVLRRRKSVCVILTVISCAALNFRVGGPQTQALPIVNHWPVQDAVCIFKLIGNYKYMYLLIFKLGELGKITEATFAEKRGSWNFLEVWSLASANTRVLHRITGFVNGHWTNVEITPSE